MNSQIKPAIESAFEDRGVNGQTSQDGRLLKKLLRGIDRDAELVLALDRRGESGVGVRGHPSVYLAVHVVSEEEVAAVKTAFRHKPDTAYIGEIQDVIGALGELLNREDCWIVRGDNFTTSRVSVAADEAGDEDDE